MDRRSEEEAWRAIVENYGERPEAPAAEESPIPRPRAEDVVPYAEPTAAEPDPEAGFVPPVPPPLPRTTWQRLVAWGGALGAPLVLLVFLVAQLPLPGFLALLLVAWFVGGFVFLVLTMPSGPSAQRPPWDDGARV